MPLKIITVYTTMERVLIYNDYPCHYEIIESVIVKHREILNIEHETSIHLYTRPDPSFKEYISTKYPKIKFEKTPRVIFDYYINCTVYDHDVNRLDTTKDSNHKYISHRVTEQLKTNPNVYFLTPLSINKHLSMDVLPYAANKAVADVPIYIIQGNLNQNRRHLDLLKKILDETYQYKFIVKLIGRGVLPPSLHEYKDKIVVRNNLNFIDYHKEFLDGYCILPLISKSTHPGYYATTLTSTINYARGYGLKCLIDKDLQDIYNLDDVEVFNDINDISSAFKKTLETYYSTKNS